VVFSNYLDKNELETIVFSHEKCDLGEGPLWSPERQSLFWLDINRKLVFEKSPRSQSTHYDNCWSFIATPTALARVAQNPDQLWVICDVGLIKLDLTKGTQTTAVEFQLDKGHRTNDAGVGPDGKLWVGTMQRQPLSPVGKIFSINSAGQLTTQAHGISIPNTFCWSPDGKQLYLTDSFARTLYQVPFPEAVTDFKAHPWLISQQENITYDGGAIDDRGYLWIACWGGARVDQLNLSGETLATYSIPAHQPTSCCFGGEQGKQLFVTSATEGLNDLQKKQLPDAGKVFLINTHQTGIDIPAFAIE